MYTYKVSDVDSAKVRSIQDTYDMDKLKQKIDNINNTFDSIGSDIEVNRSTFERLPNVTKSDAELLKEAENSLYSYKNNTINDINSKASNQQKELLSNIDTIADSAEVAKDKLKANYATAAENISNDALRRGLSRSSIVINNLNALNNEQLAKFNDIDKEVTSKVNAINFEIAAVERQKKNALNDFDIEYAVKLEEKLSNLRNELDKKQTEIAKYNNEVAKLENDYELKYANLQKELDAKSWDKEQDIVDIVAEYGAGMLDRYKTNKVYSLVKDYLKSFSHDEALRILESSDYLRSVLGDKYSTMISEI